jgi:tetratricopeptide (TPR) repeat protein
MIRSYTHLPGGIMTTRITARLVVALAFTLTAAAAAGAEGESAAMGLRYHPNTDDMVRVLERAAEPPSPEKAPDGPLGSALQLVPAGLLSATPKGEDRVNRARKALARGTAREGDPLDAYYQALLAWPDADAVAKHLSAVVASGTNVAPIHNLFLIAARSSGKYDAIIKAYEQAVQTNGEVAGLRWRLAFAYASSKNYPKAKEHLEALLKIRGDANAKELLAAIPDEKKVAATLAQVLDNVPDCIQPAGKGATSGAKVVNAACGKSDAAMIATLAAILDPDGCMAAEILRRDLGDDQTNFARHAALGLLYAFGQTELSKVRKSEPGVPFRIRGALVAAGASNEQTFCLNPVEANLQIIEHLSKVSRSPYVDPAVYEALAYAYGLTERSTEAAAEANKAIQYSPQRPQSYALLAILNLQQNNPAETIKVIEHGLERGADSADMRRLLSLASLGTEDHQAAIDNALRAVELEDDARSRLVLVAAYSQSGRWKEAIQSIDDYHARHPLDAELKFAKETLLKSHAADGKR